MHTHPLSCRQENSTWHNRRVQARRELAAARAGTRPLPALGESGALVASELGSWSPASGRLRAFAQVAEDQAIALLKTGHDTAELVRLEASSNRVRVTEKNLFEMSADARQWRLVTSKDLHRAAVVVTTPGGVDGALLAVRHLDVSSLVTARDQTIELGFAPRDVVHTPGTGGVVAFARHVVLEVPLFGGKARGWTPPPGAVVRANQYRWGDHPSTTLEM